MQVKSVYVANMTVRALQRIALKGASAEIEVKDPQGSVVTLELTFIHVDKDIVLATTSIPGEFVAISLGDPVTRAAKHPTVLLSTNTP